MKKKRALTLALTTNDLRECDPRVKETGRGTRVWSGLRRPEKERGMVSVWEGETDEEEKALGLEEAKAVAVAVAEAAEQAIGAWDETNEAALRQNLSIYLSRWRNGGWVKG